MHIKTLITSSKTLVILGQMVASGGNFALGVLLARWLGMEVFGQYSLLWMGVLFLLSLHQAYITQPLMALLAGKSEKEQSDYLKSLAGLQTLVTVAIPLLAVLAYLLLKTVGFTAAWLNWLPVTGLLASVYLLQEFIKKYCFAKKLTHVPLFMDSALFGLVLPVFAMLQYKGALTLQHALFSLMVFYLISSGLGLKLVGPGLIKQWKRTQLIHTAKEHYHYSFWLLGTSLVQWFSGNFFLVAAAGTLGAVAVGAFRMAQNMVGLCHVLFLAMENIVPAEAARQFFSNGEKAMFAYLRRIGLLGGIPVGLLLLVLSLAAPWLIGWLFGADYQAFTYLVAAYSVVYALSYIAIVLRFALRSMQFTSPIFIAYAISAAVSVLVAHPMVAHWGMAGVVAGLVGAQVLMLAVYGVFLFSNHYGGEASSQTNNTASTLAQFLKSLHPQILKR